MYKSKNTNLYSGILAILLAVLMFAEAPNIKNTQKLTISSALFPQIIGVLALCVGVPLLILGIIEIVKSRSSRNDEPIHKNALNVKICLQKIGKPAGCLLLIALFVPALGYIGTIAAGILYLFLTFLLITPKEKRNWWIIVILSISIPVAIYFLFTQMFGMVLPFGRWMTRLFY